MLTEMVYVYLIDGVKFVAKSMKHCRFFSEHEAAPTVSSIHCLYNIGVDCSY